MNLNHAKLVTKQHNLKLASSDALQIQSLEANQHSQKSKFEVEPVYTALT